jgi:uncharacterized zinc-type alcohol dehydrogenase-like protein
MTPNDEPLSRALTGAKENGRRAFLGVSTLSAGGLAGVPMLAASASLGPPIRAAAFDDGPYPAEGMAADSATGPLRRMAFQRRALGPKDVAIKLHYCGVCHSDIHTIHGDWGPVQYPQIVGHELAGEVVAVGGSAGRFKLGSRVGVGCMVNACRHCAECAAGFEQFCENGNTQTYGSKDRDGSITQGGYSTFVVVDEDFLIAVPASIDLAEAGPMMCAGITVYSPLRRWNVGPGKKIAVTGMGGLGHMAVKIATAMGAQVTVITTSPDKVQDARRFGATDVIVNSPTTDWAKHKRSFDFILDTIPYRYDIDPFMSLLKRDATLCRVGVGKLSEPNAFGQMSLVGARNAIAGSNTGGIRETQQMIDFCALHKIKPEITTIPMSGIDEAWSKVVAKQARYRYVVDMNASQGKGAT